ncbi:MAG TPA: adenylyl-sulfate kinase [Bacteroidia bacterium]|nr:adenylyl-sulfate kinase [Bacteroidia bacterium]
MIIQFCGMSGAGKTTLAEHTKKNLAALSILVEIIDADDYRKHIIKDLGFSRADRSENIRRLAFIAGKFSNHNIIPIICAINPYDDIRQEVKSKYANVKTVFINCEIKELIKRDTKGLYKKAFLPEGHKDKIHNLTGVNDPFEIPNNPDLIIETDKETIESSVNKLTTFILNLKSN